MFAITKEHLFYKIHTHAHTHTELNLGEKTSSVAF